MEEVSRRLVRKWIVNLKHALILSRVAKWVRSNGVSVAQKVLPSSENQLDSLDEPLTGNSSSSDDTTTTVQ